MQTENNRAQRRLNVLEKHIHYTEEAGSSIQHEKTRAASTPTPIQSFEELTTVALQLKNSPSAYLSTFNYELNEYSSPHVIVRLSSNGCLTIALNRVKALNALTFDMYISLTITMSVATVDNRVRVVVVKSADRKVFCAGGDIKKLSPLNPDRAYASQFSRIEIAYTFLVRSFPKPYICLLQGLIIGGAQSIYSGATYQIANVDQFLISLPETKNGLATIPFIKHTTQVPLLKYYMLTGVKIGAADAYLIGCVNRLVQHDQFVELSTAIEEESLDNIEQLIDRFTIQGSDLSSRLEMCKLSQISPLVNSVFNTDSIFDIFAELEKRAHCGCKLSKETLDHLQACSPTSLIVTMQLLNLAFSSNIQSMNAIPMEVLLLRVGAKLSSSHDFTQVVNNLLITKDRKRPQWSPRTIHDISPTLADNILLSYFTDPPTTDYINPL